MRKFLLAATALFCGVVGHAQATLILETGLVSGSGDVDNVIFNACGTSSGPSTLIQGCLNTNQLTVVNFTGTENLVVPGGGQARIEGADGSFDAITIALADPSLGFGKLQFNLDAAADGFATFQAVDQFGNVFNFANVALDGQGQNFFTLHSMDNQVAVSFRLFPQLQSRTSAIWSRCAWDLRILSLKFPSLARWLCWVSVCSALPS